MKKIMLIAVIAGLATVSCRKTHSCMCRFASGNSVIINSSPIYDTKKKAKRACENGSGIIGSTTETCTLEK